MDPLTLSGVLVAGIGVGISAINWKPRPEGGQVTCHCECADKRPDPGHSVSHSSWRELILVTIIGILIGGIIVFALTHTLVDKHTVTKIEPRREAGKGKGKKGAFGSAVPLPLEL